MNQSDSIHLSEQEDILISNTEFFHHKASILKKIETLFQLIEALLKEELKTVSFSFPEKTRLSSGKISKGNNYNNLPYIILDYPALFSNHDTFSFRTIFWWGNYFSNSFILAGKSLEPSRQKIINNKNILFENNWYLGVYSTPWKMELNTDNMIRIADMSERGLIEIINRHPFFKLASIHPLSDYKKIPELSLMFLRSILDLFN